jgi:hypothetical protein
MMDLRLGSSDRKLEVGYVRVRRMSQAALRKRHVFSFRAGALCVRSCAFFVTHIGPVPIVHL